ncbi:MAG: YfhO family protein [Calditrichaeota bacterium]|nr:YfhO family protein [Calditrichota bacterium]
MPAKKTKKSAGKTIPEKKTPDSENQNSFLKRYKYDLIALLAIYLLLVIFFAPVVFQGKGLAPAADMVASAGMYNMGEDAIKSGKFPLWNPTLFCGLPMFASLQYALFCYPPEYLIRAMSFIFGAGTYRIWIFHFLLAAIFMYLLARHYKCSRITAWLAGVAYAFSPQIIVLAEVGHGSKLMSMTYLPLILLMLDRLRIKPSVGRAAALGAVFAVEILALHPQVAAYGALLMAVYLIYFGVAAIVKKEMKPFSKLLLLWGGAMLVSLAVSAVLWVSVLDFARFSIRGAGEAGIAGGGVDWAYATGWSFHPLESITYLFPNFMGFGNQTYWGTVGTPSGQPFTHNPMYFGCGILLLALFAVFTLPKSKWGFPVTLGLTAWLLSFGKYFPLLYGLLYNGLPLFNKFRAPVMGQVLLLLSAALLAGMGLEAIISRVKSDKKISPKFSSGVLWIAGASAVLAMITLVGEGLFLSVYRGFVNFLKPDTNPQLVQIAADMARPDVARVLGLTVLMAGAIYLAIIKKISWKVMTLAFLIIFLVDITPVNKRLVSFTPKSYTASLFKPEGVVKALSRDKDKFRIHPMDSRYRAANWWSYFGLESTGGYFGAKQAAYQKLMTVAGLEDWRALFNCPQLLDALNVRYIITGYPLDMLFGELTRQNAGMPVRSADEYISVLKPRSPKPGSGVYVYRNPGELPRARLVGKYQVIDDLDETINQMIFKDWQPSQMTILRKEPALKPVNDYQGTAEIVSYEPEAIEIKIDIQKPKLLVLADSYYPSGWKAFVDGEEADILAADAVLRAIAVPAGEHTIEFIFKPKWFYVGLWVSLISVIGLIGLGVWQIRVKKLAS